MRTRPPEGCGGRWFPAEALRWTERFHEALAETRHDSAEVTERRATRAHDLARRIEKECVPIARTVDCDEHARARIRTTLNRHRTRRPERTAND